ncbi:MAG: phosphatase PAP2 family protein [Treponema sp.]|jgi:membrane-associated phospholipid phosphatase|nr:phosphatase PAP2 family protein [Treponema sp.]
MNPETIQIMPAENLPLLTTVYRWGLGIIEAIQNIENPGLTGVMKLITALGTEVFIIPLLLLIFWCIDEKRGFRLGILVILSAWMNVFAKNLFKQPRPYSLDPSLGLASEQSYGFPSGHAQMSLTLWIPIASWAGSVRKRRRLFFGVVVLLFILLIGFTRLYLGVHFPTDLLGGWFLGALILVIFYFLSPYITAWFKTRGKRTQLICAAAATLIMNGLHPGNTTLPAMLLGFSAGYSLMIHSFPFSAGACIKDRAPGPGILALRYLLGAIGTLLIYQGLKLVLPGEGSLFSSYSWGGPVSPYYELGRFIRYGLLGFWVSAGAPRLFLNLGIAGSGIQEDPASGKGPEGKAGG